MIEVVPLGFSDVVGETGDEKAGKIDAFELSFDRDLQGSLIDTKARTDLLNRLKRAEGQLRGVQRMIDEGHMLFNHGWTHASLTGLTTGAAPLSTEERWAEVQRTEQVVRDLTGYDLKPYFRPPYGDYDASALSDLAAIGYGLLLLLADRIGKQRRDEYTFRWRDAALVACAQALALVPGTSRSGVTMTAGLLMGLTRAGAARFSFLLSIPITALAGGYELLKIAQTGPTAALDMTLLAAVVAGISGYLAIAFLLRLLQSRGMTPFVVYRLLLGAYLIATFY